ncbi:MAG: ATP-NAD kinase [Archaeoglobales archaeon]|nr:MAG: ATP-NAD kinase [Archaeoglobales archaeon]
MSDKVEEVLRALNAFGVSGLEDFERWKTKRKIGFIVNPIAGMGGSVGLKGTDGKAYKLALKLNAKPVAPIKALNFLNRLKAVKGAIELLTYPREMGENEAKQANLDFKVLGSIGEETTAEDTKRAAKDMLEAGVELIVFVGGDGTARDICEVIGDSLPVLGVPAGVKMHSSVFAVNARAAAEVVIEFVRRALPLELREVMDVDEEAFRENRLSAKLYGFMKVPVKSDLVQSTKVATTEFDNQIEIARYVAELMEPDVVYVIGPGTTTKAIADYMGFEKTLLGVDVVLNGKTIVKDANEKQILSSIKGRKAKVIVTPIGGQGFIFGRGNQQISAEVLKILGKENIIVVSTRKKLAQTGFLRVDVNEEVDSALKGEIEVIVGYGQRVLVEIR